MFSKVLRGSGTVSPDGAIGGGGRSGGSVGVAHEFAFVDVETTGLESWRDRVVEIAVVVTDGRGVVLDRWCTLVNPGTTDSGPKHIHLIEGDWLAAAPPFESLLGDLAMRLDGRVLVAHNIDFDLGFLGSECERAGHPLDDAEIPSLCTMELANTLGFSRKLHSACAQVGYAYDSHNALDDATATAELFHRLLPSIEPATFSAVKPVRLGVTRQPSGVTVERDAAAEAVRPRSVLAEFTKNLYPDDPNRPVDDEGVRQYRELVIEAIEDGYVDAQEHYSMASAAHHYKLSPSAVADIHHEIVLGMLDQALADNRVNKDEKREIERAAVWLGVDLADWKSVVAASRKRVKAERKAFSESVKGRQVVFTGRGLHPNNIRKALAESHGAVVSTSFSGKTELLVIGSEELDNATVAKARSAGVEIMLESTFWQRLGEL